MSSTAAWWAVALEVLVVVALAVGGAFARSAARRFDRLDTKIDDLDTKVSDNTRRLHDEIRDFRESNAADHRIAFERIAALEGRLEKP